MIEHEGSIDKRKIFKSKGPYTFLQQIESIKQEKILIQVLKQFIKLEARTPNAHSLIPSVKLEIAQAAESGLDDKIVASRYKTSRTIVRNARRDFRSALVFVDPVFSENGYKMTKREEKRFEQMKKLQQESDAVTTIINNPNISQSLSAIPHINEMLLVYAEYNTVSPLLDKLGIPYNKKDVYIFNKIIRNYLFEESPLIGIRKLSQKIALAKWLMTGTTWNNEEVNVDSYISRAAVYLLSNQPHHSYALIESMRIFLREMLLNDFEKAKEDVGFYESVEFDKAFPSLKGPKAKTFSDIDIIKSFESYAQAGVCPISIKKFAQEIINDKSLTELSTGMGENLQYGKQTKRAIVWAGLTLLENLVLLESAKKRNNWIELLSHQRLKDIKSTRELIKVLNITKNS